MTATDPQRPVGNKEAELQNLSSTDDVRTLQSTLATAEIWLGTFLVVACISYQAARLFGYQFEFTGALGLLPLLVLWSGILLVGAGGSMRRFPEYPVLPHLPLLLWLVVFFLAFI